MDRQKKLLIIAAAWISAGLLSWFLYAKTIAPQQEKQVGVVVVSRDMPLGTLLRQSDLKTVNYPERNIPKGVVFQPNEAVGHVVLFPMSHNEPLLNSKLSSTTTSEGVASTIEAGLRAVSVQITDVSGVAGLIQPNSTVDVLFTRPGTMAEASTSTILQRVKVLSIGRLPQVGQVADPRTPRSPVVTLLLTPEDAQKLELAKNEGKISLSLRNPTDSSLSANSGPLTTEVLDPSNAARIKKSRAGSRVDPDDARVLRDLAARNKQVEDVKKKEAEKPRVVVDVYRGDKHVQELFR